MSQENVEVVRAIIDAHGRRDFDAVFAKYDPEIEWHIERVKAPASDFEPVYHGHEGVRAFWRVWFAAWERADFEYAEFIDAGDSVVTILSQRVRGRTSGGRAGVELLRAGLDSPARKGRARGVLPNPPRGHSKPPGCGSKAALSRSRWQPASSLGSGEPG
jgi:ketosteroid isomerase-like protein